MAFSVDADYLKRKYRRELKNLELLPYPERNDYQTLAAHRSACAGRSKAIKNRLTWIANLTRFGRKWL